MIFDTDLERYHSAAKLIEVDGEEGYQTCRQRYGTDIANMALIMYYRAKSGSLEGHPPEGGYDRVVKDVNNTLRELNLIFDNPIPLYITIDEKSIDSMSAEEQKEIYLYRIVKQPPHQFPKLIGEVGYIYEVDNGEYCSFHTIKADGGPGGCGTIPLNCLVEEKSDFWKNAYKTSNRYYDEIFKVNEDLLCKDRD